MIDFKDIELAITREILRRAEFYIPFEYPEAELAEYPEGLWGKVSNLRGAGVPVTLGPEGDDEYVGVIQIDVNYPAGKGTGVLLDKATEVARAFKPGTVLTHGAMCLRLLGVTPSPNRKVGGYTKVSVSINYSVRASRA